MNNVHEDIGFFKANAPDEDKLFKLFCTECDVLILSENPSRKLCHFCAAKALREARQQ